MSIETDFKEAEQQIATCNQWFEQTKSRPNVSNIPGELDRAMYVSQWRDIEYRAAPIVSALRERAKARLAALRATHSAKSTLEPT